MRTLNTYQSFYNQLRTLGSGTSARNVENENGQYFSDLAKSITEKVDEVQKSRRTLNDLLTELKTVIQTYIEVQYNPRERLPLMNFLKKRTTELQKYLNTLQPTQ